jgi:uncharacterized protein with HEPN domain
VIHHLQIIGEAARGVSQALRDSYPEVPWAPIIALRNILVHKYFGLNLHQGRNWWQFPILLDRISPASTR